MEGEEFKVAAKEMVDYIVDYLTNIRERRVVSEVEPGYLRPLLPHAAPDTPDQWKDIMTDIERVIMPGVTHWQSPYFHAYYPANVSYPAILADVLSDALGTIGFSWNASPACTELEVVMMDWLGQLIGLPQEFLFTPGGTGGGVILSTASEATLVALLSARSKKLKELGHTPISDHPPLVAYTSDQSHSSVERAGMFAGVRLRLVTSDEQFSMRGPALRQAILADIKEGLIPFYVVGTVGTTSACSYDNLKEIGEVTREFGLWFHVDAAYAGSALVCEEFRYLMIGLELAQSFNFNPHKWLLVNFDCSAMWYKNSNDVVDAFNVDPLYLKHENQEGLLPDYRHWQIPLGRRFRSLKLWFVMRMYGKQGLQAHIRRHVSLAHQFENHVKEDSRFEIFFPVTLGLVCFRLKNEDNAMNEKLLKNINAGGVVHMVPSKAKDVYFIRFAVCSVDTNSDDVKISWKEVKKQTDLLLN
ncbi:hypothetical protein Pmani_009155 [Petrolisthes manimaculis]|uniref:Aromatic-L-amino-acid decarboxylase n=1 Tax=Petrolisthes manimaculis TaxID=1843537 RepID=A0AAE1UD70_9EUCA|nr:hypothetical protein Pmani_009155 [Petrolisthes manimaculis]